jgi:hypothetical protein
MKKILFVNQVFYPDEVAVSQYVSSFIFAAAKQDLKIKVIAGMRNYEHPEVKYKSYEKLSAFVDVERLWSTGFTKKNKLGRVINFITFQIMLFFKLLVMNKKEYKLIFGSTVPPLVPIINAFIAKLKNIPFVLWVMDLQPDEAVAAGYLKKNSVLEITLRYASKCSLDISKCIIVLDNYMKQRLCNKGILETKISTVELWSVLNENDLQCDGSSFRAEHKFDKKCVIMYSGNHSVCHPLDTLLEAAIYLKDDQKYLFVFIGSGVRVKDIRHCIEKNKLTNVMQLPYQPQSIVNESLTSADIHVVVQGNDFSGLVHPSKIYGILSIGKPFIFFGPERSHIGDIIRECGAGTTISHGDVNNTVKIIKKYSEISFDDKIAIKKQLRNYVYKRYNIKNQINSIMAKINEAIE